MLEITELPEELLNYKSDLDLSAETMAVNANEEESPLTEQAMHYILDEILKRKKDLHDTRYRRNRFFAEIRDALMAHHGLRFNVNTLATKYHYIKRQFDRNRKGGNGGFKGPYYDTLMEIFAEKLAIEDAPTMASLYPALPLPRSALSTTLYTKDKNLILKYETEGEKEAIWTHANTLDFLKECAARKDEFCDPTQRRCDIFLKIQAQMEAKGHIFTVEGLRIKLHNYRACYKGIMETRRKKQIPDDFPDRWPYFPYLHEVFKEYKELKAGRKNTGSGMPRKKSCRKRKSRHANTDSKSETNELNPDDDDEEPGSSSKLEPLEEYHLPAPDTSQSYFAVQQKLEDTFVEKKCRLSPGDFGNFCQDDESGPGEDFETKIKTNINNDILSNGISDDIHSAQKMLAIVERQTIATEQLLENLKESNRIRQRKLQCIRNKLSYLKARAKSKHFF